MSDEESQKDEICVLQSIYNEEEFHSSKENDKFCGRFNAFIELPSGITILYRNLELEDGESNMIQLDHLPPISVYFTLPHNYPSVSPPDVQMSCSWLSPANMGKLLSKLDQLWEENKGNVILFIWTHFLKEECLPFLEMSNCLDISRKYTNELKILSRRKESLKSHSDGCENKKVSSNKNENKKQDVANMVSNTCSMNEASNSVEKKVINQKGPNELSVNDGAQGQNENLVSNRKVLDLSSEDPNSKEKNSAQNKSYGFQERNTSNNSVIFVNSRFRKSPFKKYENNFRTKGRFENSRSEGVETLVQDEKEPSSIVQLNQSRNSPEQNFSNWRSNKPRSKPISSFFGGSKKYVDRKYNSKSDGFKRKQRNHNHNYNISPDLADSKNDLMVQNSSPRPNKQVPPRKIQKERKKNSNLERIRRPQSSSLHLHNYLIKYNEDRKKCVFERNSFRCNICFEDKLGIKCTQFKPCDHVYCRDCITEYFEVRIKEGSVVSMPCPSEKCPSEATQQQVRELLGPTLFAKYDNLLLSATLSTMDDITYCPRTACQCPVMRESDEKLATCPSCQYVFCVYCKMTYHGIEPCRLKSEEKRLLIAQYQNGDAETQARLEARYGKRQILSLIQIAMSENWITENSKPCPQCCAAIEKSHGCNRMVCWKCNTFFCWLCSTTLDPADPYKHFYESSSRCADKLFQGTIEDEEEDIDYEDDDELFMDFSDIEDIEFEEDIDIF